MKQTKNWINTYVFFFLFRLHAQRLKVRVIRALLYYFVIKCMQTCVSFHFGWFTTIFILKYEV